jgi:Tol biopolymer transport system component
MKRLRLVVAMVVVSCGVVVVAQQKLDVELQLAIQREMASGDLKAAIVEYQRIAERAERSDRAVASRALLRLAEAHAKLGQAEARAIYERLARDFGEHKEAAIARARLQNLVAVPQPSRPQPAARRLWNNWPAARIDSVSYDGRYAILGVQDEGTGEAPVFDMATGAVRRLGSKAPSPASRDFVETGAFSRDGRLAAYARRNGEADRYEVWVANVTGEPSPRALFLNEKREFSYLRVTDWSPDQSRIAVQFSRRGKADDVGDGIGFISVPDGTLRELKPLAWEWSPFTFSPDGRRIAGTVTQDGRPRTSTTLEQQGDVFVMSVDDGDFEVVAPHPALDMFAGWSPDGSLLLFASNRGGSDALWASLVADGRPQGTPFVVQPGFSGALIGMTATGALYYHTRREAGSDVFIGSFDFSNGRRTSEPLQISGIGQNLQPAWSPDGRLAYVNRRGDRYDLMLYTPAGATREVARNVGFLQQLNWSPDSRFIFANRGGTGGGIFRIDVESGEMVHAVIRRPGDGLIQPSVSPDGKTLYFFHQLGGDEIGVSLMSKGFASGDERELVRIMGTRGGGANITARVSPDGGIVYYRRTYPDTSPGVISITEAANEHVIVERNLLTGAERELIRRGGPQVRQTLIGVNLSPDGRSIATVSTDVAARTVSLLLVSVETRAVREVMKATQPGRLMLWPGRRTLSRCSSRRRVARGLLRGGGSRWMAARRRKWTSMSVA